MKYFKTIETKVQFELDNDFFLEQDLKNALGGIYTYCLFHLDLGYFKLELTTASPQEALNEILAKDGSSVIDSYRNSKRIRKSRPLSEVFFK